MAQGLGPAFHWVSQECLLSRRKEASGAAGKSAGLSPEARGVRLKAGLPGAVLRGSESRLPRLGKPKVEHH